MSQFSSPNTMAGARNRKGRINVYTFMLVIAFLALVVACVYVLVRHHTLFGTWNPFDLNATSVAASLLHLPGILG